MQTKLFKKVPKIKRDTNAITNDCIDLLLYMGYFVWRNNSVGVWDAQKKIYRRNPRQLKGVSDILGLKQGGRFVGVEVKNEDKLSEHQELFLQRVRKMGGIALVVHSAEELKQELDRINQEKTI